MLMKSIKGVETFCGTLTLKEKMKLKVKLAQNLTLKRKKRSSHLRKIRKKYVC